MELRWARQPVRRVADVHHGLIGGIPLTEGLSTRGKPMGYGESRKTEFERLSGNGVVVEWPY